MNKNKDFFGYVSMLGTFGVLILISCKFGIFTAVLGELVRFLSGGFRGIADNHATFLLMFPTIIAVVVMEFPCCIAMGILQAVLLGKSGRARGRDRQGGEACQEALHQRPLCCFSS